MPGIILNKGMNKLSAHVNGKDVLLVGNSQSILGAHLGHKIDSFEFVTRFNLSIAHLNSCTGKKTNAWVFAMARESVCQKIYRLSEIKPELCVRHQRHPDPNLSFDFIPLNVIISEVQKDLKTDLDPSVGICTLWYLLNCCETKRISLAAFDSFLKPNFYSERLIRSNHPAEEESEYIKNLVTRKKIFLLN